MAIGCAETLTQSTETSSQLAEKPAPRSWGGFLFCLTVLKPCDYAKPVPESTDTYFPLSFCPTGMVPTKNDSPHVPVTADEIVSEVMTAYSLGITSVHVHARDDAERPAWQRDYFRDIFAGIRAICPDLVICATTSGRLEGDPERRADVLKLEGDTRPDMASLTLSSMNFAASASVNAPDTVKYLAAAMKANGIKPELEIFDTGMLNYAKYLHQRGLLEPPFVVNLILGGPATAQATPAELGLALSLLPQPSVWLAGGIGLHQTRAIALGLASGGGVRVGLEDNLYWDESRTELATNQSLIQRTLQFADLLGRKPMPPVVFRERYLND